MNTPSVSCSCFGIDRVEFNGIYLGNVPLLYDVSVEYHKESSVQRSACWSDDRKCWKSPSAPYDFGIGYGDAFINRIRAGVGTGPADTAAAGPIV